MEHLREHCRKNIADYILGISISLMRIAISLHRHTDNVIVQQNEKHLQQGIKGEAT